LYDAEHGVGACGDWILDPSICGAWEIGRRLSKWIVEHKTQSAGLPPNGSFRVSGNAVNASIGNVR